MRKKEQVIKGITKVETRRHTDNQFFLLSFACIFGEFFEGKSRNEKRGVIEKSSN